MVVNSIRFLLFFVIVFTAYYALQRRSAKWQNLLLFIASYVFYGIADIKMIPLLFGSTLLFYFLGHLVERCNDSNPRAALLWTTIGTVVGIGILFYFKYLGFFVAEFSALLGAMGIGSGKVVLSILMPLGISFFTFRLISYPIEIHRRHISASHDFVAFGTYIAFFPTILSGPIDCPKFIDQLRNTRTFNYEMATDGCRQILWGMFKKMVIANNLGQLTSCIWAAHDTQSGLVLIFCALVYTFYMYTDFSGYSDMAIGVGKLLGLRIRINFNYPLFADNIAEYWRRWHISLTSWLTDYVFMPLSVRFRDWGKWGLMVAVSANIILVGLWHGANWTFAAFGVYHSLLFIPLILNGSFMKKSKLKNTRHNLPTATYFGKMICVYLLVSVGLIIFAAPDIISAGHYLSGVFCRLTEIPNIADITGLLEGVVSKKMLEIAFASSVIVLICEWKSMIRKKEFALQIVMQKGKYIRYIVYTIIFLMCIWFNGENKDFIYMQF